MTPETIYVPLLDEGTEVWRPVAAERCVNGTLRILGEMPEDENWAYMPGELVVVRLHTFADGRSGLVAFGSCIEDPSISSTRVELTLDEMTILCNALNEVCNGVDIGDEFETRIGSTVETARGLLARLSAIPRRR